MAPKAYDDEELERLQALEVREDSPVVNSSPGLAFFSGSRISLGEVIAFLTALYFCTIASFNAGYFSAVHGNFVQLFTFTDLIAINIPILQYFIVLFFVYAVVSTYVSILERFFEGSSMKIRKEIESFTLKHYYSNAAYWTAYGILLALVWVGGLFLEALGVRNFTVVMLPVFVFQTCFIYFFWVGYKFDIVNARSLVTAALLSLLIFSNNAGYAWLRSEISSQDEIQAFINDKDVCLERVILRNSGAGLLLYNPTMKQFEFRNKDSIKTIFQGRGCT
jgi:hypothetical protein